MTDRGGSGGRTWLACGLLLAVLVARALLHEPWRDELQAWSIVRASEDFADLVWRTREEDQGKAWYLCLFALDRAFGSFAAVQAFHAALAAASVLIVVRWAPFTAFQKTAFALGYFAFFEYAVIARPYALGMLAVCVICATWDMTGVRRLATIAAVVTLAATSIYGVLLAGALATAYVFRRRSGTPPPRVPWLLPLLFAAGAVAVALFAHRRFANLSESTRSQILGGFEAARIGRSLTAITDALLPVPVPRRTFWNSSLLRELDEWGPDALRTTLQALPAAIGAVLLGVWVAAFWRCRAALIVWVLGAGGTLAFAYAFFHGYLRHHGHVFLALVAAAWIAGLDRDEAGDRPEGRLDRLRRRAFDGVLAVQAVAGLFAAFVAAFVPFSPATACARTIRDRGLEHLPGVARPDVHGSTMAVLLERPWYFPQGKRWGTYIIWDSARMKRVGEAELLRAAEALRDEGGTDVLVVTDLPLAAPLPSMELLAEFPEGVVPEESYVVYRLPARR